MDESIKKNLVAQQEQVEDLNKLINSLQVESENNETELEELKARSVRIKKQLQEYGYEVKVQKPQLIINPDQYNHRVEQLSYEEITKSNLDYLTSKGLLDKEFDSLFTPEELLRIERELSSPIQREKWDKWDFVAVLSGGIAGVTADYFTGGIDTALKDWLGNYHINSPEVAIDYQGPSFGGGDHRALSSGHDVIRIFSAIWQIKNGTFVGLKETPTGFEWIKNSVNQYGKPFDTYDTFEAFFLWVKHLMSDFITPKSLPYPGMSFLMDMPDHEIRKFAIEMYKKGFNLRFMLAQALAPALVEIIVRGYVMGREYKESGEIKFPTAKKLKTTELLLTSHAMVTAVNVGKVAIRCHAEGPLALRKLNIPSIIMTVRYFIPFVIKRMKLNDPVEILKRNAQEIIGGYDTLILQMNEELKKDDEFRRFLENGQQIVL